MSERIAEFESADDAWAFRNMKGKEDYEVCGGLHMMWAVMPKIRYATNLGRPDEPPESAVAWRDEYED